MVNTTALRLTGRDALALLHRIGTQKLDDLPSGQARATLFCDFRGRLLHRAAVGVTSDGAVWLLRDDAPGDELAAFLDRHVFRDDVAIEDRSGVLPVGVAGPEAEVPTGSLQERDDVPVAMRVENAVALVCGPGAAAPLDPEARVRLGRPAHGREIRDAFTPFEVGLGHEVHLDKGCFTGQEALMRLVTYRSVKRRLVRVGGDGAPPDTPMELRGGGESAAGVLTSAIADGTGWIGLAVVRNEIAESGGVVRTAGGASVEIREALPVTRSLGRP